MTLHNAVSASITNQDASPRVAPTAGIGGAAQLETLEDFVVVPAAAAAASIFRILRVKTNIILKTLHLESEAQGAGKVNIGVYYADSAFDVAGGSGNNVGTGAGGAQILADTIDADFFDTDEDLASAVARKDITGSNDYTVDLRQKPLWQALGLASDPGGKFDICATVHTTDVTTGTGRLALTASYVAG